MPVESVVTVDHPRIRGEHEGARARELLRVGIIPAYAGSTSSRCVRPGFFLGSSPHTRGAQSLDGMELRREMDHPRIRGEHGRRECGSVRRVGIIPAYAGSTREGLQGESGLMGSSPHTRGALTGATRRACIGRDHPRIRGEHAGVHIARAWR